MEAVAELHSPHTGNRKHRMRNQGFDRIEKRLTRTCRHAFYGTFHYSAKRIPVLYGLVQDILPLVLTSTDASHFHKPGIYAYILNGLLGHYTCSHHGQGQTS